MSKKLNVQKNRPSSAGLVEVLNNTLKGCFSLDFLFIFALLAIFFFLIIGTPLPPGLLYASTTSSITSHPAYADMVSGAISTQMLEENIDQYNGYLLTVISLILANVLACLFLGVLVMVVICNYLVHNKIVLKYFWKSLALNICLIFASLVSGLLLYLLTSFIGSLGGLGLEIAMLIIFSLLLYLILLFVITVNFQLHITGEFVKAISNGVQEFFSKFYRLLFSVCFFIVILGIIQLLASIAAIPFTGLVWITVILNLMWTSWLFMYVYAVSIRA
jgi:hypothetical protein